jgi:hypothetical protein
MNEKLVYEWEREIASHLPSLNKWQQRNMALFSQAIVKAQSCVERQIAAHVGNSGEEKSMERRLQRFIANEKINVQQWMAEWTGWVMSAVEQSTCVLLVDECKIGDHLSVMMVGLAYEGRCIPLAWRCYQVEAYPSEGQVEVVLALLRCVKAGLPNGCIPLVQADRGIGNSPALMRGILELGWRFLLRVTKMSKFVAHDGQTYTLFDSVQRGESWQHSGAIYKKRGHIPAHARVVWHSDFEQPWALVTNDPALTGSEYAWRYWQEQAFRDLKSRGWQWQRSGVWLPEHATRLLMLLALAYAWILALGAYFVHAGQATPLRAEKHGFLRRRLSLFQEGLRCFRRLLLMPEPVCLKLFFASDKRLC